MSRSAKALLVALALFLALPVGAQYLKYSGGGGGLDTSTLASVTGTPAASCTDYWTGVLTKALLCGSGFILMNGGSPPTLVPSTIPIGNGGSGLIQAASQQVTTAGTAVSAGTTQAQTGVTVTGVTTTSACFASVPTALPATWQTGIRMTVVVTANTATLNLTNPTAGSITPAAQAVNIKCIL